MIKAFVQGTAHWNTPIPTNQHYVVSYLASLMDVTYSESIKLRRPPISLSEAKRITRRLRSRQTTESQNRHVPEHLKIISTPAIPFHGKLGRVINQALIGKTLLKNAEGSNLFWTYTPTTYGLENICHANVYHCVDLYETIQGINPKVIRENEKRLAEKGVTAIGSSKPVVEHLKTQGFQRVEFWPNVADVSVFIDETRSTEKLRNGVVFAGNLTSEKLDEEILIKVAKVCQSKNVPFTLIGPLDVGAGNFTNSLNQLLKLGVRYLGPMSLSEVAQELHCHAIGIIPYKNNSYNFGVSPLKLYEYLASGLSVVSTPLPSIKMVEDTYKPDLVVSETNDFVGNVESLIDSGHSDQRVNHRIAIAKENSWDKRYKEINSLLHDLNVL